MGARTPSPLNGGFEAGGAAPAGWQVNATGPDILFTRDTNVFHSGGASGKITTNPTRKISYPAYSVVLTNVVAGEFYEASAWVKTALGRQPSFAYLAYDFLDAKGKRLAFVMSDMVAGDADWTRITLKALLPPATRALRLCLILRGPGTAWFDDAMLARNDSYCAEPRVTNEVVHIRSTGDVIKQSFSGFGAEVDPWLFNAENRAKGVTAADVCLITERMKAMNLSMARVFVEWKTWNPSGDRVTFDWNSDGMQSLYRTLDICEQLSIDVNLCGVEWGQRPYDDPPAAARALGALLERLSHRYHCVKYWTLSNEPHNIWRKWGYDFDRYVLMHRLVIAELKARGLSGKIAVTASDDTGDLQWFRNVAQRMSDCTAVYAMHHYVKKDNLEVAAQRTVDRLATLKQFDKDWPQKKLFLAEFGVLDKATTDQNNQFMRTFEHGLCTAALLLDQLALGIDGATIWCLHRIYYPGNNFMDYGLWEYKNENWKPRPVWFAYSLFTKFIPRGSRVIRMECDETEGLVKISMARDDGGASLFVLNSAYNDVPVAVDTGLEAGMVTRYGYDASITNNMSRPLFCAEPGAASDGKLHATLARRSLTVFRITRP